MTRTWLRPAGAAIVVLALTALYLDRLDYSPIHLHYDEIFFGLQAHSIQTTGHDLNGRRWPVYFQLDSSANWYQPIEIYWTALVLTVVPLSDGAIRLPTALLGVVNTLLLFGLARRLLSSRAWALAAALMLALTPAHFIHSRLAMDYLYPLPFTLAWLWCLLEYFERRTARWLFAATSFLGLGLFSYIAAVGLMPIYLGLTCLALLREPAPVRPWLIAIAGMAWPLLVLVPFIAMYPEVVPHLMSKYHVGQSGSGLDPMQQLRESINTRTVSDLLNRYHRYFSPGYLFVSGGSNLTNSNREAGVFLAPMAVFLLVGIHRVTVEATRVRMTCWRVF